MGKKWWVVFYIVFTVVNFGIYLWGNSEVREAKDLLKRAIAYRRGEIAGTEYEILQDVRITIRALRPSENWEPIKEGDLKLNSVVEWLGKGSRIILEVTPVDTAKWRRYFKEIMEGGQR